METSNFEQLALVEASKSLAKKRKVGAIIVEADGTIIGSGHNHNLFSDTGECEDEQGNTLPSVVHAEVAAIKQFSLFNRELKRPLTIYITHQPCENCQKAIKEAGIENIVIVNQFMKFDTTKLRYDLIPPSSTKALASVFTYGAKKYKPNNWQMVDDPNRYIAAAMRHFEAYRSGEINDPESTMPHLWHAMTNIAFLVELDYKPEVANDSY